ncbi:uncharacterized protein PRCAT00002630001 [Priceomyces carsonii]|uniref:uncharacterized protein n=1 Tax=Priceomyces carsonii TaxID=28549 RepID=UPI002ED963A9|nr:unnamed protein product [Priceomyces carsonii]
MISSRNIRVLISLLAIFAIVAFFASSQNSLSGSVQKATTGDQSESPPFAFEEDQASTLKNRPHKGTEPPYSVDTQKEQPESNEKKPQVIADKSTGKADPNKDPSHESTKELGENTASKEGLKAKCDQKNYAVMIDAGSTGSRVHVYEFDSCVTPPKLLNEKFEMIEPGLSSFDTDTVGAAKSLDPLLKVALDSVPKKSQSCTPVAVKATAGLRKLGNEKSQKILDEVRRHLESKYPFAVVPGDGVSIMDGKDEGVYAWITTNYLLGNIGTPEKVPTAAIFDLGGGSTQIVFEPEFGNNEEMVEGEHKVHLTFGRRDFILYQFSHLGFGLMEARNKINALVLEQALKSNNELSKAKYTNKETAKAAKGSISVFNPCIAQGIEAKDILVEMPDNEYYVVNMKGPSTAAGFECRYLAETVLNKEAECSQKPCSFNGVHQPSLTRAFRKSSDMFVFSFFYDRTIPLGFPSSFTVEELSDLAKIVCSGDQFWKNVLLDDHVKELSQEPQWCLDLSFITAMLHTGYDIPSHRELRTVKKIDGNEVGWCLGASLPLLDKTTSGWECKVESLD